MRGDPDTMPSRMIPSRLILAALVLANVATWLWAFAAFGTAPSLLGMAGLAWLFGLRHAVDADHIAAIDNAVRKLAGDGAPSRLTGLFFSLGHSTVVVVLAAIAALAAGVLRGDIDPVARIGGYLGTAISALFLALIAGSNLMALREERRGGMQAMPGGLMTRLTRPLFRLVRQSRDMYPIGFLFGLGFDTATEIGLLALSAAGTAHGLAFWRSMALPALFTAGMSLIDTADSMLMTRAYGWALRNESHRRRYNIVLTTVSVLIAVAIGAVELLGLFGGVQGGGAQGGIWRAIAVVNAHWSEIGMGIALVLAALWLVATWRLRGGRDEDIAEPATRAAGSTRAPS